MSTIDVSGDSRDWISELVRSWNESYPRMDISSPPGALVMFDGRGGYEGEQKSARAKLTMRGLYTVDQVNVGGSSSSVRLVGVDGWFNTCLFSAPPAEVATSPSPAPQRSGLSQPLNFWRYA